MIMTTTMEKTTKTIDDSNKERDIYNIRLQDDAHPRNKEKTTTSPKAIRTERIRRHHK